MDIIRETGTYRALGELNHFIPDALPPNAPAFVLDGQLINLYGEASFALGQLNEMSARLPDPYRFIKAYVIKEALLSSAIEGIHTTLVDVLTHHSTVDNKINKDTQLVLNYTKALETSVDLLKKLPLASRVILQAHEILLSGGEGEAKTLGHYRKQSVRVGHLVPPPAQEIPTLMSELEKYINDPSDLPLLIRAGLVHVQFETIHPFLDGNGRIGRLLIVLMLIDSGLLQLPILYPSFYFKKHHDEYYQRLDSVRKAGDFEGWINYYLKAIRDSAQDAYRRAKDIEALELRLQHNIQHDTEFVKSRDTASEVLDYLFSQPITDITTASQKIGKSYNTVANTLNNFVQLGLVSENKLSARRKLYHFDPYLNLLEQEYS